MASLIDHLISMAAGITSALLGFRLLGPKPGMNAKYDALYGKWIRHLKWLGPVTILISGVQIAMTANEARAAGTDDSYKRELRKSVETSISENGTIAERDRVFESNDGFRILIPAGFTYSKPPNTNIGLVAIYKPDTVSTPAVIVAIETAKTSLDDFSSQVKQSLLAKKDKTYKFAVPTMIQNGNTRVQRTNFTAVRNDGQVIIGSMLLAAKGQKYFLVNVATTEAIYKKRKGELERVIVSFGLL